MSIFNLPNTTRRVVVPTEFDRILDMPKTAPLGPPGAAAYWSKRLGKGTGVALRTPQGGALDAIHKYRSAFCSITVGGGKALIALLAGEVCGAKRPLILCPPALVPLMHAEAEKWEPHFKFTTPEIVSYGILSTQKDLLERLRPDLIIADEAHCLRNLNTSRTSRVGEYIDHLNPSAGFVALSGTITNKSLLDHAHLLWWCLRDRTPIPSRRSYQDLHRWAACLDPDGEPTRADRISMIPLVRFAGSFEAVPTRRTIRDAYRRRLVSTPGVIATTETSCNASLYLIRHEPPPTPTIKRAIDLLEKEWVLPDGEPVADASLHSRARQQVALGFYYRWEWGSAGEDLEWLNLRRRRNRLIAKVIRGGRVKQADSPRLVEQWSLAGGGSRELRETLIEWREIEHRARPQTVAVWLDRSRFDYLDVFLAQQTAPTLVWYRSKAVEAELEARGFIVHGPGSKPPTGGTCAASIGVHGKGQNLQMYANAFIIEPPGGAGVWEQLIGRHHRSRFDFDALHIDYFSFDAFRRMKKARGEADYIEETQGSKQKLNLASFLKTGFNPTK